MRHGHKGQHVQRPDDQDPSALQEDAPEDMEGEHTPGGKEAQERGGLALRGLKSRNLGDKTGGTTLGYPKGDSF